MVQVRSTPARVVKDPLGVVFEDMGAGVEGHSQRTKTDSCLHHVGVSRVDERESVC